MYMYVQVDTLFLIRPTTCWKYCIFNIVYMDHAKMNIVPFHICEQMKPESVSVIVHPLLSISTFVRTLENR